MTALAIDILQKDICVVPRDVILVPFIEEYCRTPEAFFDGFRDRPHQIALLAGKEKDTKNFWGTSRGGMGSLNSALFQHRQTFDRRHGAEGEFPGCGAVRVLRRELAFENSAVDLEAGEAPLLQKVASLHGR